MMVSDLIAETLLLAKNVHWWNYIRKPIEGGDLPYLMKELWVLVFSFLDMKLVCARCFIRLVLTILSGGNL
jgi:hypothetical protein